MCRRGCEAPRLAGGKRSPDAASEGSGGPAGHRFLAASPGPSLLYLLRRGSYFLLAILLFRVASMS